MLWTISNIYYNATRNIGSSILILAPRHRYLFFEIDWPSMLIFLADSSFLCFLIKFAANTSLNAVFVNNKTLIHLKLKTFGWTIAIKSLRYFHYGYFSLIRVQNLNNLIWILITHLWKQIFESDILRAALLISIKIRTPMDARIYPFRFIYLYFVLFA